MDKWDKYHANVESDLEDGSISEKEAYEYHQEIEGERAEEESGVDRDSDFYEILHR